MKETLTVIILALVVFRVTTPSVAATPVPEDRWLYGAAGYARALELQREKKVPLVVYFYADWCPYCQELDRDYLTAAPVKEYLRGVVKVRIDPEQGPAEDEIATQYRVTGYPAFFVIGAPSAQPRKVHPFRRGGKNLTPAEFAKACELAAAASSPKPITRPPTQQKKTKTTGSLTTAGTGNITTSATRPPKVKALIVEVPPSRRHLPPASVISNRHFYKPRQQRQHHHHHSQQIKYRRI